MIAGCRNVYLLGFEATVPKELGEPDSALAHD